MDLTTAPAAGAEGLRTGSERNDLLSPGRNCWRIERAVRLAVIVDAARYFAAAKAAIRQARRSVMLIGWQFDLRIRLEPDRERSDVPDELGPFLKWVAAERPVCASMSCNGTPPWSRRWRVRSCRCCGWSSCGITASTSGSTATIPGARVIIRRSR